MPEREYERRQAERVTAIRWTGENTADVLAWLGRRTGPRDRREVKGADARVNEEGDLQFTDHSMGNVETVRPGQFIRTDDDGYLRPMDADRFEARYMERPER